MRKNRIHKKMQEMQKMKRETKMKEKAQQGGGENDKRQRNGVCM